MARKLDLNALVLFYEVVNAGSMNRAAQLLGTPKATISRKLSPFGGPGWRRAAEEGRTQTRHHGCGARAL